jgi:hypothetical protein
LPRESEQHVAADRERGSATREHEHAERRQEAPGSAEPETAEVDPPGRSALGEEERRDEESADHEEDVDAEITPDHRARREVKGHDEQHGERPQAIESPEPRVGEVLLCRVRVEVWGSLLLRQNS